MIGKTAQFIFGAGNYIFQLDERPGPLFWTSRLHVDADGSGRAYHRAGSPPGLDYLANAGSQAQGWWGISVGPDGRPYIQTEEDPNPGFYISTTALEDYGLPRNNPARYVDSEKVPFFVLPSKPHFGASLADLGMFFNLETGASSWGIYADVGPANQIGEGSMKLNENLGFSSDAKTGGTEKEIIATVLFPGSKIGWPRSNEELEAAAKAAFEKWGGLGSLKAGLPNHDWSKF
jgi:hypothetical protein